MTVTGIVGIIGASERQIELWVRSAGLQPAVLKPEEFLGAARPPSTIPDVLLIDVRSQLRLLDVIPNIKRHHPAVRIAMICSSLDPTLMLDAMRAGVNECVPEPITQEAVESAVVRLLQAAAPTEGRVFAVVGAKGGVGATTIAVNLAQACANRVGDVLLIDLNLSCGDAATFFAVEPRFTVIEALENTHRLDEAFFRSLVVHTSTGLDLLSSTPGPGLPSGTVDVQRIRTLIDFAARYYRLIVLDVPRTEAALDALDTASGIFVVVNQELLTVRLAHRLVAKLRERYGSDRIGLLVNRADGQSDISPQDIQKTVNAGIRHAFPSDYRLAIAALNKGEPVVANSSKSKLGSAFRAFGKALTSPGGKGGGAHVAAPEPSGMFGWLTPRRSTSD